MSNSAKGTAMLAALSVVLQGSSALGQEAGVPKVSYPPTARGEVVETHFGHRVADPYRWLEADIRADPEVAGWVAAQNRTTRDYLATLPGRDILATRLAALLDTEQYGLPVKRAGRVFYTRQSPEQNQPVLRMRDDAGEDRVILDPNGWSADAADALAEWAVSDNGRHIAFAVQRGGSDWRMIRVLEVDTGEVLKDRVDWVRFSQIAWAADGSGFYYSRFPEPERGTAGSAPVTDHAIHFHGLGTPQAEDRLIHSDPAQPHALQSVDRTDDGRFLVLYSLIGTATNALAVINLHEPDAEPRRLIADFEAEWTVIGNAGERLYLLTSDGAERRRIVTLDLAEKNPKPVEVVPEDAAVLTTASLVGGRLLAKYLVDANSEIRRFALDGTPEGTVALPGIGSASAPSGLAHDAEAFYIFSSYDTPITVYRYDVAEDRSEVWAEPEVPVDLGQISVSQMFYASKDGTRIPLFVLRGDDVSGPVPTLLYGYGGFGISLVPVYNPMHIAWVEQGGAVAIANIRGGGEYGRAWHAAGQFENRQNAFDDFIAAGEFLKAEGIAAQDGLAIHGESNGGLLVGAVTNQRPDLFAAALPGVGVMDMLRFHSFTGGTLWISDFGSPEEERHFRTLLRYSPYHTLRTGTDYPAILAMTAESDDRVVPGHTFKYVAALQAAELGPRPRLLRVDTRAGHGAGAPRDKLVALYADMWAFAARWTGLTIREP